jgi:hypothetical protein
MAEVHKENPKKYMLLKEIDWIHPRVDIVSIRRI